MAHLTQPNVLLDPLIKQTPPGMMFWSGTCADPVATCGTCAHLGYDDVIRNDAGNAVDCRKHPASCALFHRHTKQNGQPLPPSTPACKYFEAKRP